MPKSIFELEYFPTKEAAQAALDKMPFGEPPLLHLPAHNDVKRVRAELYDKFNMNKLRDGDILLAYQELALSTSSSDVICGVVTGGHRCGGIMDTEVSVFGAYYQCRVNSSHRFPV